VKTEPQKRVLKCFWQHYAIALSFVLAVSSVSFSQSSHAQSGTQVSDPASRSNAGQVVVPLRVSLSTGGAQVDQSLTRAAQFFDDINSIPVHISTEEREKTFYVDISLIAVSVEGFRRNQRIEQPDLGRMSIAGNESKALELYTRGLGLFTPGTYRIEINVLGYEVVALPFEVVQKHSNTEILTESQTKPKGFNVALRAFGATIMKPIESGEEKLTPVSLLSREPRKWEAVNLIDGAGVTYDSESGSLSCRSCGWLVKSSVLPADIVIKLAGDHDPLIESVVLEPYAGPWSVSKPLPPKHIEISVSDTNENENFQLVASARMQLVDSAQVVRFTPIHARYMRVRLLDAHDEHAYLGEIRVMEAHEPKDSVLAKVARNLASPDLGGVIAYYSSSTTDISRVVDGIADASEFGWHSDSSGNEPVFPQDLVFAFRDDREAFVDRLEFNPVNKSSGSGDGQPESNWAHGVSIAVSSGPSPTKGFRELGQFLIEPTGVYQAFEVAEMARFVRVRVLSNNGDPSLVSLGEVKIIEGNPGIHDSILVDIPAESSAVHNNDHISGSAGLTGESDPEPNDESADALPVVLDQVVSGRINNLLDVDQYRIDLRLQNPSTLNLKLAGAPNIRTAMALFSPDGALIREFDPGGNLSNVEQFSWHLAKSGTYRFSLSQPPASVILVWDASGSMQGSTENLEKAVLRFLDNLEPGEQVNMIRFSGHEVEVLLPDFTDDVQEMRAAIKGKFTAMGGTPLYDALGKAMDLMTGVSGNRAVILLSDGLDLGASESTHAEFWEMLRNKAQSQVHVIGLGKGIQEFSKRTGTTGERFLRHVAAATGGQALFSQDSADLENLYEEIGSDLRAHAAYEFTASISKNAGNLRVEAEDEQIGSSIIQPAQVALILDASGSMRRGLDGERMIDTAKAVLNDVVDELSVDSLVSLRVFGHRINEGQEGDCLDSELLVPFSPLDRDLIRDRLQSVSATGGTTLITHSLRMTIEDFGDVPGWKLVVLVTDGEEECEPDVEKVLRLAEEAGIDMSLNIVGFALAEESLKEQLSVLSASTGGRFFDANDAVALREDLKQAIAVPYEVYDSGGALVDTGLVGESPTNLPEGKYSVKVRSATGVIEIPIVEIEADSMTSIRLQKTGDQIGFSLY
jgi:VWFA-related protein